MDKEVCLSILRRVREKKAADHPFASALHHMVNRQLRAEALKDVRNVALTSLGAGLGGRALVGLFNMLRPGPAKTRSGPAELALPVPVEEEDEAPVKKAGFWSGDAATSKAGIPWYGPAVMFSGLGGLLAGWKGMGYALDKRRQAERKRQLEKARREFHEALLAQYDRPVPVPKAEGLKAASAPSTMEKVGAELDALYDDFQTALHAQEKRAAGWFSNAGGALAGGYGMYSGLTGLLVGALVYDKMKKRSRQAVIDKALKRRERRQFMQAPTEVYAVPEPVGVKTGSDSDFFRTARGR